MSDNFMFLPITMMKKQMITEIRECNEYTSKFGIQLSEEEINLLVDNRKESLVSNGRIEFGGGVIRKIIMEFADSPYIYQENYINIMMELQECFYYFKNESLEEITDDELIRLMKKNFDNECQGSVEYLQSTILENISRDVRYDLKEYQDYDGYDDNYIEFFDWDKAVDRANE